MSGRRVNHIAPVTVTMFTVMLGLGLRTIAKDAESNRSPYEGKSCLTSGCHATLAESKHVHAPTKNDECGDCHEELDDGDHKFEMTADMPDMCYECHDEEEIAEAGEGGSVHSPVSQGDCRSCHTDHASDHKGLLIEAYSTDYYIPYEKEAEEKYTLCFECHDAESMEEEETDTTGFRNGEKNLHYLHVNRAKGRNCRLCHTVHVSDQQRLIRSSVPFGKWTLKLFFASTENSGACGPSCHSPKRYDRENPVNFAEDPKLEELLKP